MLENTLTNNPLCLAPLPCFIKRWKQLLKAQIVIFIPNIIISSAATLDFFESRLPTPPHDKYALVMLTTDNKVVVVVPWDTLLKHSPIYQSALKIFSGKAYDAPPIDTERTMLLSIIAVLRASTSSTSPNRPRTLMNWRSHASQAGWLCDMIPEVHCNLCNQCYTLGMPDPMPDIRCVQYFPKVHYKIPSNFLVPSGTSDIIDWHQRSKASLDASTLATC